MNYILYDVNKFKSILKSHKLSIRKITNPQNDHYCGVTDRTITRSNSQGAMTSGTYYSIMRVVDISNCVIAESAESGITLAKENFKLKNQISNSNKIFIVIEYLIGDRPEQVIGIFTSVKTAKEAIEKRYYRRYNIIWETDVNYRIESDGYHWRGRIVEEKLDEMFNGDQ